MKRIVFSFALLFSALLFSACLHGVRGSGNRKTEKRDLPSFTSIETTGAFEVEVKCQQPASFEVEADDNILPLVETEVRGSVLYIKTTKSYNSSGGIIARITVPDLISVKSTGAGKFRVTDVKTDSFEIKSTGAAQMVATGQTKSLKITSTGAGKIDAHNLRTDTADVDVTGAAGVEVKAVDELNVKVSGAGRVIYTGDPKINKKVSGAGQVTKKESTGA